MTVISPSLPPSRPGSVALIAGDLALDFANSESGRGFPSRQDHLQAPGDVAQWLAHAGALDRAEGLALQREIAADSDLAGRIFGEARALRDDVHAVGAAIARRAPPPEGALAGLTALHARCLAHARLVPHGARRQWGWTIAAAPLEGALGPVTLAATMLLTDRDPARIKECGGVGCGWLFHDATKNNRRRWCEMEVCGNRAKQRRHSARSRGA